MSGRAPNDENPADQPDRHDFRRDYETGDGGSDETRQRGSETPSIDESDRDTTLERLITGDLGPHMPEFERVMSKDPELRPHFDELRRTQEDLESAALLEEVLAEAAGAAWPEGDQLTREAVARLRGPSGSEAASTASEPGSPGSAADRESAAAPTPGGAAPESKPDPSASVESPTPLPRRDETQSAPPTRVPGEGDERTSDPELRPIRRLPLWVVGLAAAAALMLIVLLQDRGSDGQNPGGASGDDSRFVTLNAPLEGAAPSGRVESYTPFQWEHGLQPAWHFEVRIYDDRPEFRGTLLHEVSNLIEPRWTPDDALEQSLPDAILWEVRVMSGGTAMAGPFSARASR